MPANLIASSASDLPSAPSSIGASESVRIRPRDPKPAGRKAWSGDDGLFIVEWPILRLAAALLPERRWFGTAMALERAKARFGLAAAAARAAKIQRAMNLPGPTEAEAIAWRCAAGRTEHHIQVLKAISRPGWQPEIEIHGREHVESASARGKGAILWVAHFCFNTLITKIALQEAGFPLTHLSRVEHGFSTSAFGIRWLNPLRCAAELRYLRQRIVIDPANPGAALRQAHKALATNGFVSITAGAWEGRKVAYGPLLGGTLPLAIGAPGLAHRTGAVLLPVFTTRLPDSTTYRVQIGPPLPTDAEDGETAIRTATAGFLGQLESAVRAAPDQWRGWKYLAFSD